MAPHRRADLLVDLHAFSHQTRTAVFAEDDVAVELGLASGVPFVVKTRFDGHKKIEVDGFTVVSSNTACRLAGIPAITIELSGQRAVLPGSVEQGRVALLNLLKHVGILPGKPALPARAYVLDPWRDQFAKQPHAKPSHVTHTARHAGIFVPHRLQYDHVRKGDLICEVINPYTGRVVESARAPMAGALYSIHLDGRCGRGDRLFIVATTRTVSPSAARR